MIHWVIDAVALTIGIWSFISGERTFEKGLNAYRDAIATYRDLQDMLDERDALSEASLVDPEADALPKARKLSPSYVFPNR